MANRNAEAENVKIGPAWWYFKGVVLGYCQDSNITNETEQHDTLVDQKGNTPIASTSLGGVWSAEFMSVELNRGILAALIVGAEAVEASSAYATDGNTGVEADKTITFDSDPGDVKIGDKVDYTDSDSSAAEGIVAQYDIDTYTVTLSDDDNAPSATPAGELTAIEAVKFYNTAGVNLFSRAGVLMAIPLDTESDDNIYVLPNAGLRLDSNFVFKVDEERQVPMMFTGYPDDNLVDSDGNSLSFFMGKAAQWEAIS